MSSRFRWIHPLHNCYSQYFAWLRKKGKQRERWPALLHCSSSAPFPTSALPSQNFWCFKHAEVGSGISPSSQAQSFSSELSKQSASPSHLCSIEMHREESQRKAFPGHVKLQFATSSLCTTKRTYLDVYYQTCKAEQQPKKTDRAELAW